jgi:hypothetical protein
MWVSKNNFRKSGSTNREGKACKVASSIVDMDLF